MIRLSARSDHRGIGTCDTIVATKEATGDDSITLVKNSNRDPHETQYIGYHPAP